MNPVLFYQLSLIHNIQNLNQLQTLLAKMNQVMNSFNKLYPDLAQLKEAKYMIPYRLEICNFPES